MSIRNQEIVYRINKYADFPQESRNFFLDSGIVPVIDWEKVRSYDSVYTLPGSATVNAVGTFRCFQVPVGKRYKIKRLFLWSGDATNTFSGIFYLGVEGDTMTLSASEINGVGYNSKAYIYLEFEEPLELRPRSDLKAIINVKGGADSLIVAKMWGSITNDY